MEVYYLKCPNCGFLNEVKTEYMTFCSSCSKKLENNFQIWLKKNGSKTFEDYKHEVCITSDMLAAEHLAKPKKKINKKPLILTGSGALIFVTLFSISYIFGFNLISSIGNLFASGTSKTLLGKEWKTKSYGTLGLTISSPIALLSTDELYNQLPPEVKNLLVKAETYQGIVMKRVQIFVGSLEYQPQITANLDGATAGTINNIQAQKNVSDVEYEIAETSYQNIPGKLISGGYLENEQQYKFSGAIYVSGSKSWMVMVTTHADEKDKGDELREKIIKSIKIKV